MTEIERKLVGSWDLERFELKNMTLGRSFFPYGRKPVGILMFNADGYMSVSVMAGGRKNFAVDSFQLATKEEKVSAAESYLSYADKWNIEDDKVHVEVMISLLPNSVNQKHYRTFQIDTNHLIFQTPVFRYGAFEAVVELSWRRV